MGVGPVWRRPLGRRAAVKRLVRLATLMAANIGQSLPRQCSNWADLKAAYRLLSNEAIRPESLHEPHRRMTWEACGEHPVVLAVQDDTHLAGRCDREAHTTLVVLPSGDLLGVLDQRFFEHVVPPPGEKRSARAQRWRESQVWSDAVEAIGSPPLGCRLLHVADRASDDLAFFEACESHGVGFVVRAKHDRRVEQATDKLWGFLEKQAVAGSTRVRVGEQRNSRGTIVRRQRDVAVDVRFARVQLERPWNHPHPAAGRSVWAVYLSEPAAVDAEHAAEAEHAVDWVVLTSEPVECFGDALRLTGYYTRRWVIEEWHRALKEGCRLEASQLDDPEDHLRLTALLSIMAVRLLQLRDLAKVDHPDADDPAALRRWAPRGWIAVVAHLAGTHPSQLTLRQFFLTIAKRGGYLNRRRDPPPGWKVLWRGWYDISLLVEGAELAAHPAPD